MRSLALSLLLGAFLAACGGTEDAAPLAEREAVPAPADTSASVQTFEAMGVVRSVTPSRSYVMIAHDDIPGFMDAMTMSFAVADTTVLSGLGRDDRIAFTFTSSPDGVTIQSARRVE